MTAPTFSSGVEGSGNVGSCKRGGPVDVLGPLVKKLGGRAAGGGGGGDCAGWVRVPKTS